MRSIHHGVHRPAASVAGIASLHPQGEVQPDRGLPEQVMRMVCVAWNSTPL